jgi:DNA modification methylase
MVANPTGAAARLKDCTRKGDIVLDTFSGSGTTIMAAERVARPGRALRRFA